MALADLDLLEDEAQVTGRDGEALANRRYDRVGRDGLQAQDSRQEQRGDSGYQSGWSGQRPTSLSPRTTGMDRRALRLESAEAVHPNELPSKRIHCHTCS